MANFYQAGYAYLQVLPSLKGFPEALEAQLRAINPEMKVTIRPEVETAGVDAASEAAGENAGKKYSDAFGQMVNARIRAALEALPAIKPEVDATEAQLAFADLREELESLAQKRIGVEIDPADALIALAEIRDKLREIEYDAQNNIDIRVDATKAFTEIDNLLNKVRELDHFNATVDVSLNEADFALAEAQLEKLKRDAEGEKKTSPTSGGGSSPPGAGGGRLGYLAQLAAVGGSLGGGAISSAALLAIPALFGAIGVAAEKSDTQVQASFHNLESTAKDVSRTAFEPLAGTLSDLADKGASELTQLKGPLSEAAAATAPLIDQLGTGLLRAVDQGVRGAAPTLNQLSPVVDALSGGFSQLEQGIASFFSRLDKTTAGTALTSLFAVVQQLLPAIASLLNAVTPLGTALAGVLGSAIKSTATALETISPVLDFVAGIIQSLSGFIGAQVPVLLTFGVTIRLLSGKWTDLSTAMQRSQTVMKGIGALFNTQSTQFARLASLVGVTTAAENQRAQSLARSNSVIAEAAVGDATLAKAKAQATANAAEQSAAEARATAAIADNAAATTASEEATLSAAAAKAQLARADLELQGAEAEAAAATTALAETTDVATFSMAPILGILAAVGLAFGVFALQSKTSGSASQDVSGQLVQMGSSVQTVNSNLNASSADLKQYTDDLTKIGSTVALFSAAYSGSLAQANEYTNDLTSSQKKLGDQVLTVSQSFDTYDGQGQRNGSTTQTYTESVQALTNQVNGNKDAYNALTPAQKSVVDEYNAFNEIIPQAQNALAGAKAAAEATTQELARQGVTISDTQNFWNNYGNTVARNAKNFNDATSGIKSLTDASVTADAAFYQAQDQMRQLAVSAAQAAQAESQAHQGVTSAQHGVEQSIQGVSDARHQEAQSAYGVLQAQQQLQSSREQEVNSESQVTKAQEQSRAAQVALTQSKIDAAQAIRDLNRQVTDQGDTEAEAKVRLVQARQAVLDAHLQGRSLSSFGDPTTQNLKQYQLVLSLQEAQHNLNDQLAQGSQLRQQSSTANRAGVSGSSQVISATQAIAQAQEQLRQSIEGATQARQGVESSSRGVTDAQYQEQQSHLAVGQAAYQETQAQQGLKAAHDQLTAATAAKKLAQDADTTSVKLNTAQGVANFQMIETLFEDNLNATGTIGDATQATIAQGHSMHFTAGQVQEVIDKVTGLNGSKAVFGVVGEPSINLSDLINTAARQGLDPKELGFSPADIGNARAAGSGIGPTHADGGLIVGPGTGTSDSVLAYGPDAGFHRVSNGEFVVNAEDTRRNLPLLHSINSGQVPGHANGGQINFKAITRANFALAEIGGMVTAARGAFGMAGFPTGPSLPAKNPPGADQLGVSDAGGLGGGPVSYAAGSGVAQWAPEILQALRALGQPASWLGTVEHRMNQESGGNPNAINLWDINAQEGHPSIGLMQTIQSTYDAYKPAGANNIRDPYSNIFAGLNYAVHRYGSLGALNRPGGYDEGGFLPPGLQMVYNNTGRPEPVFNHQQWDAIKGGNGLGASQGPVRISGSLKVNGLDGYIDGRIEAADAATSQLISSGTR